METDDGKGREKKNDIYNATSQITPLLQDGKHGVLQVGRRWGRACRLADTSR